MGRHKVDARPRFSTAPVEQIRGTSNARRKIRHLPFVAFPEFANGVSEAIVPFCPAGWKFSDLVSAGPAVPGLGNELDRGQDGVLSAGIKKAAALVETVRLTR